MNIGKVEQQPFTVEAILAEATSRTGGLDDLGDGPFVEPLALFLESLEREARLNDIGRVIARERALGHTVNRLGYVHDRHRFPAIADEHIVAPVFIIGFPRTGTTILHDILAQDPDSRAPLTWEVMFPSPPPEAETFATDPRIATAAALLPNPETETERDRKFRAMHPMGATLSQECVVMMGEVMCTPLFHNQFRVPSYEDWVDNDADWSHVYDFHYRQLQHLQWRNRRDRWVLKTGAHLWGLEHLLCTYPDARIVFTHRDPVDSVTSYASLTTLVRTAGSDQVDPLEVARDWTARLRHVIDHAMTVRSSGSYPDAIFYDVHFTDFVTDQFAVVSDIYEAFGLPMTDHGADRMRAFIADNPQGKHGVHSYTPEQFGIDPDVVRRDFAAYIDRYDLARG
ncbi:MAG: sulfotransferase [Actinobacteria bacterium]|nr:sulfotransferase [Actinomycetota bacterium]